MNPKRIKKILQKYYEMDHHYEDGKVLGSMYTYLPEIVLDTFIKFYQANLGNEGMYPGTKKMEEKVLKFLLTLSSAKASLFEKKFFGHIVSGGTEANITALWIARNMGFNRILTTKDAHFSIRKAANILNIPLEEISMNTGKMDTGDLESKIRDGDIVVATAGTTPLGIVDPIKEIGKICGLYDCFMHVDAAFGGFVIPFLRELGYMDVKFGFDVPEVMSLTIDPHKMGMAPYPAGAILMRGNLFKYIEVDAPYLVRGKNASLLGTRQSGSVAAAYASILYFGWNGYREIVKRCMENMHYAIRRIQEEGFEIFIKPELNILNIKLKNPSRTKREFLKRGWSVSINPSYRTMRIVFMPHVTTRVIENFLKELKNIEKS